MGAPTAVQSAVLEQAITEFRVVGATEDVVDDV